MLRAIAGAGGPRGRRARELCADPRMPRGPPAAEAPRQGERAATSRRGPRCSPLGPDERPPALLVAIAVCALLAIGVVVGALTVHDLSRHGGSLPGAALLAALLVALAVGMARRRYWAVLSFEAPAGLPDPRHVARVDGRLDARGGGRVRGRDRAGGLAVLEARAGDGPHPGGRTREGASLVCGPHGRELLRLHSHRLGARRVRGRAARGAAREAHGGRRARQARRALPELRLHPGQGGAALGRPAHRDARGGRLRHQARARSRSTTRRSRRGGTRSCNTLTSGVGGLFRKHGIDVLEGSGSLQPDGSVSVGGQTYGAQGVVLATGSVPRPIPGAEFGGRVIGTEEAWALAEVPARLAVVGAGASGTEIASAYARLGSEVLLLEALERVLPTEDADISKLVERGLKRQGIQIHTATPVADVKAGEDRGQLHLRRGAGRGRLARDRRRPGRRRRGARAGRGGGRARRAGAGARWTARCAPAAPACGRSATSCSGPGARAQGLRRGHHRRRRHGRAGDPSDRPHRHPAGHLLPAQRRDRSG